MKRGERLGADPDFGDAAAAARQLRLILAAVRPGPAWQRLHRAFVHVEHQPLQGAQRGVDPARRAGWIGLQFGSGKCIGVDR